MNKINEGLSKAFDNIMEQQNKMDNKAYLFIGFIIFIFSFINKDWNNIGKNTWLLVIIAIPLIMSLIPIANSLQIKLMKAFFNKKNICIDKINIFYYLDLYNLEDEDFIESLKKEYNEQDISRYDEKLVEQILVNAKILKAKVLWHNFSQLLTAGSICIIIFRVL